MVQNNFKVLDVWNDTSNIEMKYQTGYWFNKEFLMADPQVGIPVSTTLTGLVLMEILKWIFTLSPMLFMHLRFNITQRNVELAEDADTMLSLPPYYVICYGNGN
jgi:hypothetical protein